MVRKFFVHHISQGPVWKKKTFPRRFLMFGFFLPNFPRPGLGKKNFPSVIFIKQILRKNKPANFTFTGPGPKKKNFPESFLIKKMAQKKSSSHQISQGVGWNKNFSRTVFFIMGWEKKPNVFFSNGYAKVFFLIKLHRAWAEKNSRTVFYKKWFCKIFSHQISQGLGWEKKLFPNGFL